METKALINLKAQTVELSGTEDFVSKYLDIFKQLLQESKITEEAYLTNIAQTNEKLNSSKSSSSTRSESKEKKLTKPYKSKSITVEAFEIDDKSGDKPSLESFLQKKEPGNASAINILVIGYYITCLRGATSFTEGNIDYAYKTLSLPNRPNHIRQIITNAKNDKVWFEQTEDGKWKLSRAGEIFVEQKLPKKK